MQVENDYDKDVYNGDLGVVSRIDMEEGELHVDFDGHEVSYGFGELMSWCWRTRQPSTRARARNTQPS
jgi:ATP-dependent exoDNAse (exonuclease V) alpha subunit